MNRSHIVIGVALLLTAVAFGSVLKTPDGMSRPSGELKSSATAAASARGLPDFDATTPAPQTFSCDRVIAEEDVREVCGSPGVRLATPQNQRDGLGPGSSCLRRFTNGIASVNVALFLHPDAPSAANALARADPRAVGDAEDLAPSSGAEDGARAYTVQGAGGLSYEVNARRGRIIALVSGQRKPALCSPDEQKELAHRVVRRLPPLPAQGELPVRSPSWAEPAASGAADTEGRPLLKVPCLSFVVAADLAAACGAKEPKVSAMFGKHTLGDAPCVLVLEGASKASVSAGIRSLRSIEAARQLFLKPLRDPFVLLDPKPIPRLGDEARFARVNDIEMGGQHRLDVRVETALLSLETDPKRPLPPVCTDAHLPKLAAHIVSRLSPK